MQISELNFFDESDNKIPLISNIAAPDGKSPGNEVIYTLNNVF